MQEVTEYEGIAGTKHNALVKCYEPKTENRHARAR